MAPPITFVCLIQRSTTSSSVAPSLDSLRSPRNFRQTPLSVCLIPYLSLLSPSHYLSPSLSTILSPSLPLSFGDFLFVAMYVSFLFSFKSSLSSFPLLLLLRCYLFLFSPPPLSLSFSPLPLLLSFSLSVFFSLFLFLSFSLTPSLFFSPSPIPRV